MGMFLGMLRLLIAWNLQDSTGLWEYRVRGDTGEECREFLFLRSAQEQGPKCELSFGNADERNATSNQCCKYLDLHAAQRLYCHNV